jgi:hypothetical protein
MIIIREFAKPASETSVHHIFVFHLAHLPVSGVHDPVQIKVFFDHLHKIPGIGKNNLSSVSPVKKYNYEITVGPQANPERDPQSARAFSNKLVGGI